MKMRIIMAMAAVLCAWAVSGSEVATSTYDGDKVPTSYQWTIVDGKARLGTQADVGTTFTAGASGRLETVTVTTTRKSYSLAPTEPRVWIVTDDANGLPGDIIDTLECVPPAKADNVVMKATFGAELRANSTYWLLCPRHASNGNVDGWVSSDLQFSHAAYAKWPMAYRQKEATAWTKFNGAVPAFKVTVSKTTQPPPVVTPPVVTPPVVTPPVVTPPETSPSVAVKLAAIDALIAQLNAIVEQLEKLKE